MFVVRFDTGPIAFTCFRSFSSLHKRVLRLYYLNAPTGISTRSTSPRADRYFEQNIGHQALKSLFLLTAYQSHFTMRLKRHLPLSLTDSTRTRNRTQRTTAPHPRIFNWSLQKSLIISHLTKMSGLTVRPAMRLSVPSTKESTSYYHFQEDDGHGPISDSKHCTMSPKRRPIEKLFSRFGQTLNG
jgi:hypothetical protein